MNILLVKKSSPSSIIRRLLFQKPYRFMLLLRATELTILVSVSVS